MGKVIGVYVRNNCYRGMSRRWRMKSNGGWVSRKGGRVSSRGGRVSKRVAGWIGGGAGGAIGVAGGVPGGTQRDDGGSVEL